MSQNESRPEDLAPNVFDTTLWVVAFMLRNEGEPTQVDWINEIFTDWNEALAQGMEELEGMEELHSDVDDIQVVVVQVALDADMPSRYAGRLLTHLLDSVDLEDPAERRAFVKLAKLTEGYTPRALSELPALGGRLGWPIQAMFKVEVDENGGK